MSRLAGRFPLVKQSNRAYVGFLNKLRADVFDRLLSDAQRAGVAQTPELLSSVARFVNTATGRGDLGSLTIAGRVLSTAFFSPRLLASRVNMLNPLYYRSLHPFVRKQALGAMARSEIDVLGWDSLSPDDVETLLPAQAAGKVRLYVTPSATYEHIDFALLVK